VLCWAAGGATGFAIGGFRYLNLPADPAFSTAKLKANRLINTSGALLTRPCNYLLGIRNLADVDMCRAARHVCQEAVCMV
jgi:hypothetical protein